MTKTSPETKAMIRISKETKAKLIKRKALLLKVSGKSQSYDKIIAELLGN